MGCKLELPTTGTADGLVGRFNTILPEAGSVRKALLVDAANQFFVETERWRYEKYRIDMQVGDQEIDIDTGGQQGHVMIMRVADTLFAHRNNDCHDRPIPVTRKANMTPAGYGTGATYYSTNDSARFDTSHRTADYRQNRTTRVLEFFEGEPGHVQLVEPLCENLTLRIPMILTPISIEGINQINPEILTLYREGIVSLAVVKALLIPNKSWSKATAEFDPREFMTLHSALYEQAKAAAIEWSRSDESDFRPIQDRMSVTHARDYDPHGNYQQ